MKKWYGIRHIRFFFHAIAFILWSHRMSSYYISPNPKDIEYLHGIRKGLH